MNIPQTMYQEAKFVSGVHSVASAVRSTPKAVSAVRTIKPTALME